MLHDKHIRIVIASDGTCSVDALRFSGPACQLATREIVAALGGQVIRDQLKPEARARERIGHEQRESAR